MTTALDPAALDIARPVRVAGRRRTLARRSALLGRALWLPDRALTETRWAAITLAAMAALSLVAKLIDPSDGSFDLPLVLGVAGTIVAAIAGWWTSARPVVHWPPLRYLLGPAVLAIAMLATGRIDLVTLQPPAALPLVILALSYAAITPGYPIAAAIYLVLAVGVGGLHALSVGAAGGSDPVSDSYVVRVAVTFLAATGMCVVVRVAMAAEDRAARYAERSRRRVDHLEQLDRIARRFDGSRPVAEVMQDVVHDVAAVFEIPLVSIYLPQPDGRLSMVGVAGYHAPFDTIEPGVGVIGRAAATRQTQFVPDVLLDPDYRAARDDVRSEVAIPIVHDGHVLGVINFEGTSRSPIGTTHVVIGEMLGRAVAASLRAARLDEERRARLHGIERVLEVSRGLVGDLDRRRTIDAVIDAATDLLGAEHVLIARRTRDGTFRVEGESGDPRDGTWRSRALDDRDTVALAAIASGETLTLAGRPVPDRDRYAPASEDEHPGPIIALPIRIDEEVAGVLVAVRAPHAPLFGALERGIGDLLATQVGLALRNADRHATVRDAAVRDPLTGLLNRRYFDEAVETAFATARRTGSPLSLIVLDLDRFSMVNNEHGHAAGDMVLRAVALAIETSVRLEDTVARYGGEEFVVIAPGTGTDGAVRVAERIRSAIAALEIEGGLRITTSAGVAALLGDEVDGRGLFRAADSALLTAKRAGRDRVVAV